MRLRWCSFHSLRTVNYSKYISQLHKPFKNLKDNMDFFINCINYLSTIYKYTRTQKYVTFSKIIVKIILYYIYRNRAYNINVLNYITALFRTAIYHFNAEDLYYITLIQIISINIALTHEYYSYPSVHNNQIKY